LKEKHPGSTTVAKKKNKFKSLDSEIDSGKSLHLPTPFHVSKLSGLQVLLDLV
jgi:hypothetical protein